MANNTIPSIMSGFYEPDCACTMSSDMSTSDAATQWESLIAPLAAKGTVLGSPSMCKQYDEDFLTPFKSAIQTDWDVTSIHINKPNVTEAQKDVEYYVQTYGKKVWVSEFACVNDQPSWSPCTVSPLSQGRCAGILWELCSLTSVCASRTKPKSIPSSTT